MAICYEYVKNKMEDKKCKENMANFKGTHLSDGWVDTDQIGLYTKGVSIATMGSSY